MDRHAGRKSRVRIASRGKCGPPERAARQCSLVYEGKWIVCPEYVAESPGYLSVCFISIHARRCHRLIIPIRIPLLPRRGELACLFILLAMITWLQSVALYISREPHPRIYKKRGYAGNTYFALQSSAFQTLCSLAKIQIIAYFSTGHTDRLGIASPAGESTVDISNSADARRLSDIVGRGDGKVQ